MLALLAPLLAKASSPRIKAALIGGAALAALLCVVWYLHSVKQAGVAQEREREMAAAIGHQTAVLREAARVDEQVRSSSVKPQDTLRKEWERPE
jgi:hypothetical protein